MNIMEKVVVGIEDKFLNAGFDGLIEEANRNYVSDEDDFDEPW